MQESGTARWKGVPFLVFLGLSKIWKALPEKGKDKHGTVSVKEAVQT